ncbi:MAG: hypothetical protein JXB39_11125 [Deltaproteobacteria bacterium]|nr:hypothetical protein [Deltaproteobacteria bacterium]
MRLTRLLAPTLRESPADAASPGQALLARAGLLRIVEGHPAWLPLGTRALTRLERHASAALEAATGPWEEVRVADGALLAVAAALIRSWRLLPQAWGCAAPPPPGEGWRPPFAPVLHRLLVEPDRAALDARVRALRDALGAMLADLGLDPIRGGGLGGGDPLDGWIHVAVPSGPASVLACASCGRAVQVSLATGRPTRPSPGPPLDRPEPFPTPGVRTIDDLASPPYAIPPERQLKTLVLQADGRPILAVVRGDHALSEARLGALLGARILQPAPGAAIRGLLGALPGSLGAVRAHLPASATGVPVWVDRSLSGLAGMVTGANREGHHVRGVDVDRDLASDRVEDLRLAAPGDGCPNCPGVLEAVPALAVAHLEAWPQGAPGLSVLGRDAREVRVPACAVRVDVGRLLQAVVDRHHDAHGLRWPGPVAPFEVTLLSLAAGDPAVTTAADVLYRACEDAGLDVLYDDRDERAGPRFKDADLYGSPVRLALGRRGLAEGTAEWRERSGGDSFDVPLAEVVPRLLQRLRPRRTP